MIWIVAFAIGLAIGLVVGRWWALLAAVAFGAYIAVETEVDVPPWLLGLLYGVVGGAGIAAGVLLRRRLAR